MRYGNIIISIFFTMMLSYVTASCVQRNMVCYTYSKVSDCGWDTCSYVSIYFNTDDTILSDLDVSLELRSTADYSYANLWLEVLTNIRDTTSFDADTVQLRIADDNGARLGTFTTGLYTQSFHYKKYNSVAPGRYNIRIRHLMTASPLQGIRDVGIKVERK